MIYWPLFIGNNKANDSTSQEIQVESIDYKDLLHGEVYKEYEYGSDYDQGQIHIGVEYDGDVKLWVSFNWKLTSVCVCSKFLQI